ncbi:MAG: glycosyl hydrolase [Planctomycetota bacterium]|jgi:hypothetical protein
MKKNKLFGSGIGIFIFILLYSFSGLYADLKSDFVEPPVSSWPRPLWFWNDTEVTVEPLLEQMQKSKDLCRYGGFAILPFGKNFGPEYLSEEYFTIYGAVLKQARQLNLTLSLYDELGFPSGAAGAPNSSDTGLFETKYPELTQKRLDKHEEVVVGPTSYRKAIPPGKIMSIVAMNTITKKRVHLTDTTAEGLLRWTVPSGTWRIMFFNCVKDGYRCCDYLDPEAVDKFIEMTHQAYYERFREYFGSTIDSAFYDEPYLSRGEGRVWTDNFNEKFQLRHGFDPRPYYPALWYDIGPQTQAVRNYLFGFRAELYACGFSKRIQDWCSAHKIESTGHHNWEEAIDPVDFAGDLIKCFKYQSIPGVDKIGLDNRPAEKFYKIISSAAYNWDRALVMSETYGAMDNPKWDEIYAIAMDQYTQGINVLIPHAIWYDDRNVRYKPELSYRSEIYADGLAEFNTFLARLNVMLQNDAGHVSDIAILYPIASLQGEHVFDGPISMYKGNASIPQADYVDVGQLLTVEVGRDYTFVHPEVLDQNCSIEDKHLVLRNKIHPEKFKVIVLPGHKTILWSNLKNIKDFYDRGGKIIATGQLPFKSAELGHDKNVVEAIEAIFGSGKPQTSNDLEVARNNRGGIAIRIKFLNAQTLREGLNVAMDVYDVDFEGDDILRYIHKRKDDCDVYYFANLSQTEINTPIRFRGRIEPQSWNPHNGQINKVEYKHQRENSYDITRINLPVKPLKSVFILSSKSTGNRQ